MRLTSERLQRVRTQRDADGLWEEVSRTGTPLVEHGGHLVTFLWRDDGATENVVVVGGPATWDPVEADRMARLPDTDVWFRSYSVQPDLVATYWLSPNDSLEAPEHVEDWTAREATFRPDPLNPRRLAWPVNPADPATPAHERSVLAPGPLPTGPAVSLDEHVVTSRRLGNTRSVWVASLPGNRSAPTRLVAVLDGWVWAHALPVAPLLVDVAERRGPLVVALVDALDEKTRDRELECHPSFVEFLTEELVPLLRTEYAVAGRIALVGQSLGGLTAVYAGLRAPDVVGAVGAQSGSFWWPRDSDDRPQEALTGRVLAGPPAGPDAAVVFHLETGSLEGADMVPTARRLGDALTARGHRVGYAEPHGGHDWLRWQLALPGLVERMLT